MPSQRLNQTAAGLLSGALLAATATASAFGVRSTIEQPKYTVVEQWEGPMQLRQYGPRMVAEVTVPLADGGDDDGDRAFNYLFRYISGANQPRQKVAMTSPVETVPVREKIAMTTPVEVADDPTSMTMRFFLPAKFTADTAPAPTDPRVTVHELPEELMAARRIRGGTSRATLRQRESELRTAIGARGYQATGEARILYYDPPFTPPPLRQTDIVIPVARVASEQPAEASAGAGN